MQLEEIKRNITARRNRIFLLMEEVRRLRIQQRLKVRAAGAGGRVGAWAGRAGAWPRTGGGDGGGGGVLCA